MSENNNSTELHMAGCMYNRKTDTLALVDVMTGDVVLIIENATKAGMPSMDNQAAVVEWIVTNYEDVLNGTKSIECDNEDEAEMISDHLMKMASKPGDTIRKGVIDINGRRGRHLN